MNRYTEWIIASLNHYKINEITSLLSDFPIQLTGLQDYDDVPDILENGSSFYENAFIKANTIYNKFKKPVIAEDSGLMISALNGEPGIYSARYSFVDGKILSDQMLVRKVLDRMKDVPENYRAATFVSSFVLFLDYDNVLRSEKTLEGSITFEPLGEFGFAYDSIFYLPEFDKTFAQMSLKEKNTVSHRFRAFRALIDEFKSLYL